MNKQTFMKMLANADVDDTTEFWEGVYDSIRTQILQEVKDKMPKEKETITVVYYANGLPNPDKSILLKENIGFNEYRSQMLEIIEKLK